MWKNPIWSYKLHCLLPPSPAAEYPGCQVGVRDGGRKIWKAGSCFESSKKTLRYPKKISNTSQSLSLSLSHAHTHTQTRTHTHTIFQWWGGGIGLCSLDRLLHSPWQNFPSGHIILQWHVFMSSSMTRPWVSKDSTFWFTVVSPVTSKDLTYRKGSISWMTKLLHILKYLFWEPWLLKLWLWKGRFKDSMEALWTVKVLLLFLRHILGPATEWSSG